MAKQIEDKFPREHNEILSPNPKLQVKIFRSFDSLDQVVILDQVIDLYFRPIWSLDLSSTSARYSAYVTCSNIHL